jgi:hypothetical protein
MPSPDPPVSTFMECEQLIGYTVSKMTIAINRCREFEFLGRAYIERIY